MNILAIDPGNVQSAYTVMDTETFKPSEFGKVRNEDLQQKIREAGDSRWNVVVIERIQSYGMAVGREVFETCEWIGRFTEDAVLSGCRVEYIYRIEEKRAVCHNPNAKDSNIRRALIDRFAEHDFKNGKGTKKNPDWFYGFHSDIWQSYAIAFSWVEKWRLQCKDQST